MNTIVYVAVTFIKNGKRFAAKHAIKHLSLAENPEDEELLKLSPSMKLWIESMKSSSEELREEFGLLPKYRSQYL